MRYMSVVFAVVFVFAFGCGQKETASPTTERAERIAVLNQRLEERDRLNEDLEPSRFDVPEGPIRESKLDLVMRLVREYQTQSASLKEANKRKQDREAGVRFYRVIIVEGELSLAYALLNSTERDALADRFGEKLLSSLGTRRIEYETVRQALEARLFAFEEIDGLSSDFTPGELDKIRKEYMEDLRKRGLQVEY